MPSKGQITVKVLVKTLRKQTGWEIDDTKKPRELRISRVDGHLQPYRMPILKDGNIKLYQIENMVDRHFGRPDLLAELPWFRRGTHKKEPAA